MGGALDGRPALIYQRRRARIPIVVYAFFFDPTHKPCTECGASVELASADEHACDAEQRVEYGMFRLRHEIAAFETDLNAWLGSAEGRFAVWLAGQSR